MWWRRDGRADTVAARWLWTFAGIRVSEYDTAKSWYERLLGAEPSFSLI
jgi:glutathione S-transferase